ncbi:MAG: hypothetical protein LBD53_01050 [Tannerella sp.]|jgi:hypothetical protein|nr:hypothetical protein [Tannerella sp.]
MARTIDEIQKEIIEYKNNNSVLAQLTSNSTTAIWRLWTYVFACAIWTLETLFDHYREEVEARIEAIVPHRAKWYRMKSLEFMKDRVLIEDDDVYDTSEMTDEEIAAAKVIKHAVAVESADASILTIKIAGETGGERAPVDMATETQFIAYITEIKDAGVRISIINADADRFNTELDVYYDPVLLPENVEEACRASIKKYVENLPFNGEYSNMKLVDNIQIVEGVKVVEFKSASYLSANNDMATEINALAVPYAGYFKINNITINMRAHV